MIVEKKQADVFLTYCTNAVLAIREVPNLRLIQIPPALAVGADYGLTLMNSAKSGAAQLALFIVSTIGQEILARYGFTAPALPGPL